MKRMVKGMVILLPMLWAGCGSMPEVYHPRALGALTEGRTRDGLLLKLTSHTQSVSIGQPVVFQILVCNVSQNAFWLPLKPQKGFFWTYADGKHDFFVFDREQKKFYSKQECVLLQPGQDMVLRGEVETYYFEKWGITEFMAELIVAQNTNPDLAPFWSGRALTNPFGVCIVPSASAYPLHVDSRSAKQLTIHTQPDSNGALLPRKL